MTVCICAFRPVGCAGDASNCEVVERGRKALTYLALNVRYKSVAVLCSIAEAYLSQLSPQVVTPQDFFVGNGELIYN